MRIGILGPGRLGSALARRLRLGGHTLAVAFGRDEATLHTAASSIGPHTPAMTPAQLVQASDLLVLSTVWDAVPAALQAAGDFGGKVLWDCTNPLKADFSGLQMGTDTSGGEQVAALARGARVVKAIPPFAQWLNAPGARIDGQRAGVFVCSDDREAAQTVSGLVPLLDADAVDAGALTAARFVEPACMLLVHLAYRQGLGPSLGLQLLNATQARHDA